MLRQILNIYMLCFRAIQAVIMGMLLSICFKSREEAGPSSSQVQVKKHHVKKQKSLSKQHLLEGGSPRGGPGYSSTGPASPRGMGPSSPRGFMERTPSFGKRPPPPGSPGYSEMHAPGAFMTPPPSPRELEDKRAGGIGRALSFKLNPTDTGQAKNKRIHRSKSAKR